jgi:hypothetical protein
MIFLGVEQRMSTSVQQENVWRLVAAVIVLIAFATLGLLHLIRPQRFMNRPPFNIGGEFSREWHQLGMQIFGAILLAVSLYVVYSLASAYLCR